MLLNQITKTPAYMDIILWRTINLRLQVFVLQRQYVDVPSPYVDKYLCYRDNTLTNHHLTWTSICATKTIRWWTINLRGQVVVLQRQYFDEPSTYVDKYLCYRDNASTNHPLTWTSICVTETILWRYTRTSSTTILRCWIWTRSCTQLSPTSTRTRAFHTWRPGCEFTVHLNIKQI